jgi:spermidine synthase
MLYELCLTRVLSVVFYYHTAFLALSLAMLGLGAGAVWVYLQDARDAFPDVLQLESSLQRWLGAAILGMLALPLLVGSLRFGTDLLDNPLQWRFLLLFSSVAGVAVVPFVCGGVVLSRWFVLYRADLPRLYGWDLGGAALGALLLVPWMGFFGGPAALLACALLMASVLWWMPLITPLRPLRNRLVGLGVLLLFLQGVLDLWEIRIDASPDAPSKAVLYKRWNAFSRVVLLPSQGWSRALSAERKEAWKGKMPEQREALIDINAYAPYLAFDGRLEKVEVLAELVSNVAYHLLPPDQRVLIFGPGGGKDIVGALLFEPKQVTGIEINPILIDDLLAKEMRGFTGDLYRHPKTRWIVGEGRSVLQRLDEQFDVIIANSVVTWAAHSSGGMNLAEHSLYTREACGLYLDRLSYHGILSVSLWDVGNHSLIMRWLRTCEQAAKERRIPTLRDRVIVISNRWSEEALFTTTLISKAPFSAAQQQILHDFARRFDYQIGYLPQGSMLHAKAFQPPLPSSQPTERRAASSQPTERRASSQPTERQAVSSQPTERRAVSSQPTTQRHGVEGRREDRADEESATASLPAPPEGEIAWEPPERKRQAKMEILLQRLFGSYFSDPDEAVRIFPANIEAATDDRPFFLYTARLQDIFGKGVWKWAGENTALVSLGISLVVVLMLLLAMIFVPLWWSRRRAVEPLPWGALAFFLCIGLGFMFVEIPLVQRLTLFLGHPTYALTVGLASLLCWSGLGSLWAGRWRDEASLRRGMGVIWPLLLVVLWGVVWWLDAILQAALWWPLWARIVLACGILAIPGCCMGMPLPTAMLWLGERMPHAVPWAWGINGAAGVVASVSIIAVAAELGFSFALGVAWFCYLGAALLFGRMFRGGAV